MEVAAAGPEVTMQEAGAAQQETATTQGVVLVVLDMNKEISTNALNWALGHVARKGDALRLVGILTHVLNPMGYKCRVDENSWTGANRKILENELANKRYMLENIQDLDTWCDKAGVQLVIEVRVGLHPKIIAVEEARNSGAYHVVLDRTMKKDRKYFIDNLTCFVTRVRNSGGVDSIRSFAISNPLPPLVPSASGSIPRSSSATAFSTLSSNFATFMSAQSSLSKTSSLSSSLRGGGGGGSSLSSTTFSQEYKELGPDGPAPARPDSLASSPSSATSFDIHSSNDDLFSINHEAASERPLSGPPPPPPPEAAEPGVPSPGTDAGGRNPPLLLWFAKEDAAHDADQALAGSYYGNGDEGPCVSKALAVRTSMNKSSSLTRAASDRAVSGRLGTSQAAAKSVWVWTKNKDVMTASVEGGWTTFVFTPDTKDLANEWNSLARIKPLYLEGGQFLDSENKEVAVLGQVASGEQLDSLPALMGKAEVVVMNAVDWQIIPAENMVAAFQASSTALYATAHTASDAQVYLEALEKGTDGVVLHTDDPSEIFALKAYLKERLESTMGVRLVEATVTQVEPVGMGDRVCVDLCNLLNPGEGLLVGSFARALFLVHSECLESNYVASRPFRVNAGPVHAYVGMAGGRTAYLSELHTGSLVMVVNAQGQSRTVLVGRVKIESRPLLLVEAEVEGQRHSVLLQNAETVCLVAPGDNGTKALPVTSLKVGDSLLLSLQDEARHTGIQIQEFLVEK